MRKGLGHLVVRHGYIVSHELVVVWRWSAQSNEGFRKVVEAVTQS